MNKPINSPFRYPGGKFYARNLILNHIPSHSYYAEPFAGGGSIFFVKDKVNINWLNDIDKLLINTLLVIRDQPEELIKFLASESATKERHTYYKNEFIPQNELEQAGRWFYLNRTSYSGIMKHQNCYWGYGEKYSMRPENWPKNIRRTSEKLQNVKITNLDFEQVIESVPDGAFLFIDPPYFNADQDKFYAHSFFKDDHFRLCRILNRHKERIKYLVTYDNSEEIRNIYKWALEIHDKEWNYTINRTDDQKNGKSKQDNFKGERYKGKEIFILNYSSVESSSQASEQLVLKT
ncbi:MAG: DNA adenine methylase [Nostoc sp. DedVER02]|uniref:DNA adenine methylase n=1 Tax=unclassified Nostoc TaxID=2593658 RepID=UPI002AD4C015|nr:MULTISPECIES: DNA adenine methylase [unclassified Nostoc]MDZ7987667.1 DNA adenine methylase [Nostoc sp. DedVER02]MDZ8113161.1 DNA adenine methylase [Nostoc sp. DedVER01b]